jgi:predicted nuclease with TOPRIM domain
MRTTIAAQGRRQLEIKADYDARQIEIESEISKRIDRLDSDVREGFQRIAAVERESASRAALAEFRKEFIGEIHALRDLFLEQFKAGAGRSSSRIE